VFLLQSAPVYLEDDKEYVQDTVKVILHVQAQKGWDAQQSNDLEWVPLTRPYGLYPGMVFQAQMTIVAPHLKVEKARSILPLRGAMVEIERYNSKPPASVPTDEFITRTVKTDPSGVVTTTLPESGWWGLTVARPGTILVKHDGKEIKARQRSTLWVRVDRRPETK
jgi:cobalt/nickel transport protein